MTGMPDVYLPADAGVYAPGLSALLARFTPGYGAALACSRGWYPLLISLDRALAAIEPDYQVQQVKEKFATLRFYWSMPYPEPPCCVEREVADPRPCAGPVNSATGRVPADRTPAQQAALDAWYSRTIAHETSREHTAALDVLDAAMAAREPAEDRMHALVRLAEERSAVTCEECGAPGAATRRRHWVRTLCPVCALPGGYLPCPDDED